MHAAASRHRAARPAPRTAPPPQPATLGDPSVMPIGNSRLTSMRDQPRRAARPREPRCDRPRPNQLLDSGAAPRDRCSSRRSRGCRQSARPALRAASGSSVVRNDRHAMGSDPSLTRSPTPTEKCGLPSAHQRHQLRKRRPASLAVGPGGETARARAAAGIRAAKLLALDRGEALRALRVAASRQIGRARRRSTHAARERNPPCIALFSTRTTTMTLRSPAECDGTRNQLPVVGRAGAPPTNTCAPSSASTSSTAPSGSVTSRAYQSAVFGSRTRCGTSTRRRWGGIRSAVISRRSVRSPTANSHGPVSSPAACCRAGHATAIHSTSAAYTHRIIWVLCNCENSILAGRIRKCQRSADA